MLDGVAIELVDLTLHDFGEAFYPDGVYRTWGRGRRVGRYTVSAGVLCRSLPESPMGCLRVWQNNRGQLFVSEMSDRDARRVSEVRFTPRSTAEIGALF